MKLLSFLLVFLGIYANSYAHTDKYRLTLRDNPATSIVIGWNQISGVNTIVAYDTIDHGANFDAYAMRHGVDVKAPYHAMNNYFARLTGLIANKAYFFIIKDSEGQSQRFWFKTAPDNNNARLSLIAGGDSRNNREPRLNANLMVSKLKPHAILFGGDMTDGDTDEEWIEWMDDWQLTTSTDGRMYPIIAARGNHEQNNTVMTSLFDVPTENAVYATAFAGNLLRTYTLNSMISALGEQSIWLRNDLEANQNVIWKFAQYHLPMRPHQSGKIDNPLEYLAWANHFYNYGVQLVVECDAHMVKSTWPLKPTYALGSEMGFVRDDENGTVFVGEGCWGAPLRANDDDKGWTRNSASFNQFKWIFVDKQKVEIRTVKIDNTKSVSELANDNPFAMPDSIDIWKPSNGEVIILENKDLTSIKSVDVAKDIFTVYPNPVSKQLNIKVQLNEDSFNLKLYTVSGKLLYEGVVSRGITSINTNAFPNGVINVVLETGGKNFTQKVIKL